MTKLVMPEEWQNLSHEDKKKMFATLFGKPVQTFDDGGMVQNSDDSAVPPLPPGTDNDMPTTPEERMQFSRDAAAVASPVAPLATGPVVPSAPLGSANAAANEAANNAPGVLKGSVTPSKPEPLSTTEHTTVAPTEIGDIKSAYEDLSTAGEKYAGHINALRAIEGERAKAISAIQADKLKQAKTLEDARLAAEAQRQAQSNDFETKIQDANDELKNLHVDPYKFYKDRGTAGSILAAISMAAGAYGAAMTGSKNFAGEIIERAIDRDIEAQKEEISNKRQNVSEMNNIYGTMLRHFGDARLAETAAKNAMLESVADRLNDANAKADLAGQPHKFDAQLDQINMSMAQNKAQMLERMGTTSDKTTTMPYMKNQVLNAKEEKDTLNELSESAIKVGKYNDILKIAQSNPKEVLGKINSIKNDVSTFIANNPKMPVAELNAKVQEVYMDKAHELFGARMTETELGNLSKIIPLASTNPELFQKRFQELRDDVLKRHNDLISNAERYFVDPSALNRYRISGSASQVRNLVGR